MSKIEEISAVLGDTHNLGFFTLTRAHNGGWIVENYRNQIVASFSTLKELLAAFPSMVGEE